MIRRGASGDHPIVLHNHSFGPPIRSSSVGKWGGGGGWTIIAPNREPAPCVRVELIPLQLKRFVTISTRTTLGVYRSNGPIWLLLLLLLCVGWISIRKCGSRTQFCVLFSTLAVAFDCNKESAHARTHGQLKVSKFLLYSTTALRFSNFVRHRLHSIVNRHHWLWHRSVTFCPDAPFCFVAMKWGCSVEAPDCSQTDLHTWKGWFDCTDRVCLWTHITARRTTASPIA